MKYIVSYRGDYRSVATERAARASARQWLHTARVYETAAEDGWDLWSTLAESVDEDPVHVRVA